VPRTGDDAGFEEAVVERPSLVGAGGGRRVERAIDVVENDFLAGDLDASKAAGRDLVLPANLEVLPIGLVFYYFGDRGVILIAEEKRVELLEVLIDRRGSFPTSASSSARRRALSGTGLE
jgi:hypothetical protein